MIKVSINSNNKKQTGTSLVVQWLGFCASTARSTGLIPDQKTSIPHAVQYSLKKKKKKRHKDQ